MKHNPAHKFVVLSILLALAFSAGGIGSARAVGQTAPASRVVPAPVNAWTFNGNTSPSAGSVNAYMYDGAYIAGCHLVFDGVNDRAILGSSVTSSLTNASFEVWVTQTNSGDFKRVFDFGNDAGAYMYLTLSESTNHYPRFTITTGGVAGEHSVTGGSVIPLGTQAHIVVTIDSTNMARLYLNGVLSGGPTDLTLNPSSVGATNRNHLGHSSQYFSDKLGGGLNELRIYSVVLSDAEVAESYASGPSLTNCSPTAGTKPATGITSSAATLNGTVNAALMDTLSVSFEYGLDTGYGSSVAATPASVSGFLNTSVSAPLSGLTTDTPYYFRVKTVGGLGTTVGVEQMIIPHTPGIRYVKTAASGTGSCASWENACTLQTALTSVISGDELWVAAGTYKPTGGTDKTATFQLVNGIPVYGGFAGTETARAERDVQANLTTLSGDIGTQGNNSDNTYHVVTGAPGATLDGFTVTGGNSSTDSLNAHGGGIYNASSTLTVRNSTITLNTGVNGPGLYNSGSLVVENSTLSDNISNSGHGGGIYNSGTLTVSGSTFTGNSGYFGGGIMSSAVSGTCADPSTVTVLNSTFSGNTAAGAGSAIYNNYGVMTLLFNTITGNLNGGVFGRHDAYTCTKLGSNIIVGNTESDVRSAYTTTRYLSLDSNVVGVAGTNVDFLQELNQPNDQVNVADALLGTLAYNGGLTRTFALLAGSPAIDAGNDAACAAAPVNGLDQRGIPRPQGAHCDSGAYELQNMPPTDISLSANSIMENLPAGTVVGTLSASDPDLGDVHTFSLACAVPGADDASFQIGGAGGNELQTAAVFDFETKSSYAICLRATDGGNNIYDEDFTINILNGTQVFTASLSSSPAQDGWVLESGENSNMGGSMNSTATTLRLGDDAARKQYRSILSFATGAALPDNAVITKVTLKVKRQGIVGGGNPATTFLGFMLDIRNGTIGTAALQTADWQTSTGKTYGPVSPPISGGWYTFNLTSLKPYVNRFATNAGLTQLRLRFKVDDNNNAIANYLSLFSGNYTYPASRPNLTIEYTLP